MKKLAPSRWSPTSRKSASKARSAEEEQPVLQRLMIFHLGLLPSNGVLDEGSSLEELSEYILYYYDYEMEQQQQMQQQQQEGNNITNHATEEAVRFAGLCRALHSLPEALLGSSTSEREEKTEEQAQCIHLDHAMLVFVPLEGRPSDLMAVAQVSVDISNPSRHPVSSLVIQDLLQQWHRLFCVLRGGGVDVRLKQLKPEQLQQQQVGTDDDQTTTAESSTMSQDAVAQTLPDHAYPSISRSNGDGDDEQNSDTASSEQHHNVDGSSNNSYNYNSQTAAALSLLAATTSTSNTTFQASSSSAIVGGETYPGLEQLYSVRKEMRTLQKDLQKRTEAFEEKKSSLERQVEGCRSVLEEQLSLSKNILPSLREDLHIHYTERLLLANQFRLRLPKATNAPATSSPLSANTPSSSFPALQLGRVIRKLLHGAGMPLGDEISVSGTTTKPLVGISTFHRGDHWYTHFAPHLSSVPTEAEATSTLLLEYLISFREYQNNIKTRFGTRARRKTPASDGALFLSTPPLSRLSVSEEIYQISHSANESIWTPKVFLPTTRSSSNSLNNNGRRRSSQRDSIRASTSTTTGTTSFQVVHVALLEVPASHHQFLLYFDPRQASASFVADDSWTSSGLGEGSLSLVDSPSSSRQSSSFFNSSNNNNNNSSRHALSENNVVHDMFTKVTRDLTTCINEDLLVKIPASKASSSSSHQGGSSSIKTTSSSRSTPVITANTVWNEPGTALILVKDSVVQKVYVGAVPRKSSSMSTPTGSSANNNNNSSSGSSIKSGRSSSPTPSSFSSTFTTTTTATTTTTSGCCFSKTDNGTLQLSNAAWLALEDYFSSFDDATLPPPTVEQEACEYLFDQSGWIWSCRKPSSASSLYMILDSATFVTIAEVESCTDKARQMFL